MVVEAKNSWLDHAPAMADALVYATARHHGAELVTSDADFAGLPGVRLIPKP